MSTPDDLAGPHDAAEPDVGGRLQRLLRAVSVALASGADTEVVLQSCCQALVDHVGASFARAWTLAPGDDTLVLRASAGRYTRLNGTYSRVKVGSVKIGQIASERQAHMTNQVAADPRIHDQAWAAREHMVAFAGLPLAVEGDVLGVLALFATRPLHPDILAELESLADTVAQFLGREQAAALERHRLAQELHDTVSQALYGISLAVQSGRRSVVGAASAQTLDDIQRLTDAAQAELRALILGFRADGIKKDGLVAALRQLVGAFTARHRLPVELSLEVEPRIDWGAKQVLYRIAQEALSNAGRHARARRLDLALRQASASTYEMSIEDDGRGFVEGDRPGHLGLRTMRERAAARGWALDIESAPSKGTRLTVRFGVGNEEPRSDPGGLNQTAHTGR